MKEAKKLLEEMTRLYPPGKKRRHSLTLNDSGDLELTLMLEGKYYPLVIDNLERPLALVIMEIHSIMNSYLFGTT